MNDFNYLSLFTGIGGFDLGFDRAGMTCITQVENDKFATSVLDIRWPNVPKLKDVRDVTKDSVTGTVDLICGGFPCQDVSVAGKRDGLAGERSGLWSEFSRIIGEIAPTWVVVENVPGLLSSNEGRDMGFILGQLADRGYGWSYRVLDSQFFGVAQRRRRVFIVGHLGSTTRAAQILFESEVLPWHPSPSKKTRAEIAKNPGGRTDRGCAELDNTNSTGRGVVTPFDLGNITSKENSSNPQPGAPCHTLTSQHASIITFNWQQAANKRNKNIVRDGDYVGCLGTTKRDAVASSFGIRRLTPLECERLSHFPDGWTENLSDSQRYKTTGNAVVSSVSEWIGGRIMSQHKVN